MEQAKNILIILLTIALIIVITIDLQSKRSYYADGFNEGFQHAKETIKVEPTPIVKEKVVYTTTGDYNDGYDEGYDYGYHKGYDEGYHEGYFTGVEDTESYYED